MPYNEQAHILVADDDINWRRRLTSILEKEGYKVSCVTSHEEVLEIINKNDINLLCLDIILDVKQMDDWVFQWTDLLSEALKKKIPVIVITGIDFNKNYGFLLKKSEEYSVSSILSKRYLDRNQFIAEIKKVIV